MSNKDNYELQYMQGSQFLHIKSHRNLGFYSNLRAVLQFIIAFNQKLMVQRIYHQQNQKQMTFKDPNFQNISSQINETEVNLRKNHFKVPLINLIQKVQGQGEKQDYEGVLDEQKIDKSILTALNDDGLIFDEYIRMGSKWTEIAIALNRRLFFKIFRSENEIKNIFYGTLRKILRKINELGKKIPKKFTKPIKYQSFRRVLQAQKGMKNLPSNLLQESERLKSQIVEFCKSESLLDNQELTISFIHSLHKFNLESRCFKIKKGFKFSQRRQKIQSNLPYHSLSESSSPQISQIILEEVNFLQIPEKTIKSIRRTQQKKEKFARPQIVESDQIHMSLSHSFSSSWKDFDEETGKILGCKFSSYQGLINEFF